jgi:hypothetical protein
MDTFKIICLIFMIIVIYQIYQINCVVFKDKFEGFEGSQQSLGGVDDTNAINTLAQIAKNLMAGGVTVPGNINVQGAIQSSVNKWNTSADGKNRTHYGHNSNSYYGSANGVHTFRTGENGNGPDGVIMDRSGLTVNGVLNPAHSVWHTSTDGKHRIHYSNNSHSYYKTGDAHVWRNRDDHDRMVLDHNANLRVDGGLTVQGRNILAELDLIKNALKGPIVDLINMYRTIPGGQVGEAIRSVHEQSYRGRLGF